MLEFDYSLDYKTINFRDRPDLYRVGRGEQGVLLVEPYKSEILPYWRFKTPMKLLVRVWEEIERKTGHPFPAFEIIS